MFPSLARSPCSLQVVLTSESGEGGVSYLRACCKFAKVLQNRGRNSPCGQQSAFQFSSTILTIREWGVGG